MPPLLSFSEGTRRMFRILATFQKDLEGSHSRLRWFESCQFLKTFIRFMIWDPRDAGVHGHVDVVLEHVQISFDGSGTPFQPRDRIQTSKPTGFDVWEIRFLR